MKHHTKKILILISVLILLVACRAETNESSAVQVPLPASDSTLASAPLISFLEIGAESCIPCRMMQPVMKEIAEEYDGVVQVIFHDLYKNREIGQQYNIRVMPTQVFLDAEGKEFFRHEGFYPKDEIKTMLDEYLAGIDS